MRSIPENAARLVMAALLLSMAACASSSTAPEPVAKVGGQEIFAKPEDAAKALAVAAHNDNPNQIMAVLGPRSEKLVHSGDPVADHNSREKFAAAYDSKHKLENESDGRVVLILGDEEWPMPIPLLHEPDGWRFDTKAGAQEILNRRIGKNELNVMQVMHAYVDAQYEFADMHGRRHIYAQHFISTPGLHDGLYWDDDGNGDGDNSPLGPLFARAQVEGYAAEPDLTKRTPYHGYFYKILKSQGAHAPGGSKDYVKEGQMSGGFALVAFPARYGDSGMMTFLIGSDGILYERNLGANTDIFAPHITEYDPDRKWEVVP
jgi:hypothetical protein